MIPFLCDYKSVRDVTIPPGFRSWALKCHHSTCLSAEKAVPVIWHRLYDCLYDVVEAWKLSFPSAFVLMQPWNEVMQLCCVITPLCCTKGGKVIIFLIVQWAVIFYNLRNVQPKHWHNASICRKLLCFHYHFIYFNQSSHICLISSELCGI